ncbi:hypothetical protein BAE44_0003683, partial [Dichanthelium oligosanthes]
MENQLAHPQHPMSDQGFRPFTSLLMSTLATPEQQPNSSVNTTSIQMPPLPYQFRCPPDDGFVWRKYGQQTIPGSGCLTINYECIQATCGVKKLVVFSLDGQIVEMVYRGSHNHPRPSERCPGDGLGGYGPGPSAGTSMPLTTEVGGEGVEQLRGSSDSEEDDDGEERSDGDVAGASVTERYVLAPAETFTMQTRSGTSQRKDGKIQGAVCRHCEKSLSGKTTGGTSHLLRHLKTCPARPATGRMQQQQPSVEKNWKFDQDKSLELLTKALVSNLFSSPLTSSTTFRQLWTRICPTNNVVLQGNIEEKFLSIFQNEKLKLEEKIELAPGGVFMTVTRSYLEYSKHFIILTVHFIDNEWNLNRKVIRCCFAGCDDFDAEYYVSMFPCFESCHNFITGNVKAAEEKIVKEVVENWNLEWKLLGIISSLEGDAAVSALEKNLTEQNYLFAKCKLLNLPCIIDALHDLFGYEINEYVVRTSRVWFEYMTCSPLRRDKYKEILSRLQISRPSFGSQKWYLTFYSLEAALQFNNELPNPEQLDSKSYPPKPSYTQLKAAENFCDLVRSIYDAIKVVSRTCNVTLNSQFHAIWNLKIALLRSSTKENIDQVFNVEEMQLKFDQLWRKWYLWLSLAVVLDPTYKIRLLIVCFKEAFGTQAKKYILEVRGKLYELFLQYSFHVDQQN